jgi:hypothetical protein
MSPEIRGVERQREHWDRLISSHGIPEQQATHGTFIKIDLGFKQPRMCGKLDRAPYGSRVSLGL